MDINCKNIKRLAIELGIPRQTMKKRYQKLKFTFPVSEELKRLLKESYEPSPRKAKNDPT